MNRSKLAPLLADATTPESAYRREVLERAASDAHLGWDGARVEYQLARPLGEALGTEPPFNAGNLVLWSPAGGAVRFHTHEAALFLLRRAEAGRSPEDALLDLETVLTAERAEVLRVPRPARSNGRRDRCNRRRRAAHAVCRHPRIGDQEADSRIGGGRTDVETGAHVCALLSRLAGACAGAPGREAANPGHSFFSEAS